MSRLSRQVELSSETRAIRTSCRCGSIEHVGHASGRRFRSPCSRSSTAAATANWLLWPRVARRDCDRLVALFVSPRDRRSATSRDAAHYVIEGSLRQAGSQLRVAVQLVDAVSGSHLWAENSIVRFNPTPSSNFRMNSSFALSRPSPTRTGRSPSQYEPDGAEQTARATEPLRGAAEESLLRRTCHRRRACAGQGGLERAVQQAPAHSDCWAMLSIMLADEYGHGFGAARETLEAALAAARRAVDANPSNHRAYQALCWALYLRKEFASSRHAGERALALNPMDACTAVYVGQTLAYSGEWDRGCALITRAIQLNPHHPGWYCRCVVPRCLPSS